MGSSLVSFGPRQRSIGESAKTLEISNFKNTVGSLKRLIGRTASDPEITDVETKYTHVKLVDANGTVGAKVRYFVFGFLCNASVPSQVAMLCVRWMRAARCPSEWTSPYGLSRLYNETFPDGLFREFPFHGVCGIEGTLDRDLWARAT